VGQAASYQDHRPRDWGLSADCTTNSSFHTRIVLRKGLQGQSKHRPGFPLPRITSRPRRRTVLLACPSRRLRTGLEALSYGWLINHIKPDVHTVDKNFLLATFANTPIGQTVLNQLRRPRDVIDKDCRVSQLKCD